MKADSSWIHLSMAKINFQNQDFMNQGCSASSENPKLDTISLCIFP